jgi:glutamate dehydrogenase/leucine dehydrogenase
MKVEIDRRIIALRCNPPTAQYRPIGHDDLQRFGLQQTVVDKYFTGTATIDGGTLSLNSGGANTLLVTANALSTGAGLTNLTINGSSAVVDLKNSAQAVAALASTNPLPGAGGTVTNSAGSVVVFTASTQSASATFAGQITGNLAFTKSGANNQLLDENKHGKVLREKNILYAPDYVINAGGLINVYNELRGYNAEVARNQAAGIYNTLLTVYSEADKQGISTHAASNAVAERRINSVKAVTGFKHTYDNQSWIRR